MARRTGKRETRGLSLKGSGIVFVGTEGGEIRGPSRRGAGLYAWDTRHLSRYELRPRARRWSLLSAEVLPDGARLEYRLGRGVTIERHIHVDSSVRDEWSLINTGKGAARFEVDLVADADFRDLFEVRRRQRTTRGRIHAPTASNGTLRLAYTATDGVENATEIVAPTKAWQVGRSPARTRMRASIPSGARRSLTVEIQVRSTLPRPDVGPRDWPEWQRTSTRFASDSPDLDAWIGQSSLDLFLLSDRTPEGFFTGAGIPWFVAPFGRDSIYTALFALPLRRDFAPAVLQIGRAHV